MSNLSTDRLCELAELYALGGLSEKEKTAFEQHLLQCEACRAQREELEGMVEQLPEAAEPIEGLRGRVPGNVSGSQVSGREAAVKERATAAGEPLPMLPRGARRRAASEADKPEGTEPAVSYESRSTKMRKQPAAPVEPDAADNRSAGSAGELSRRTGRADRRSGYWRWMSAALSAAIIGLSLYGYQMKGEMKQLRTELASRTKELQGAQAQLVNVNKPVEALKVNQIVSLNPAAENIVSKGLASIVIDDKGTHLIVQAENLPELQTDQAFQVWLIKDNQPINAGTFYPHNGSGAIYYTFEPKDYDTVAITLEPDAHGEKPRGTLVLAAGLKG